MPNQLLLWKINKQTTPGTVTAACFLIIGIPVSRETPPRIRGGITCQGERNLLKLHHLLDVIAKEIYLALTQKYLFCLPQKYIYIIIKYILSS